MQIKVGDVVHVWGVVIEIERIGILVDFSNAPGNWDTNACVRVAADRIGYVEPRPLQVGDAVRVKHCSSRRAKIIAIAGTDAWVEWPEGGHGTIGLEHLDRA